MSVSAPDPIRFLIPAIVLYVIMLILLILALNIIAKRVAHKRARRLARAARQAAAPAAPVMRNDQSVAVIPQPQIAVRPAQPQPARIPLAALFNPPQVPVRPAHPQPVPVPAAAAVINLEQLDLEASMSMNSDDVCSICFSHRVCVTMKPCNHTYTCRACGSFFVNRPCGLCRQFVTSIESIVDEAGSDSEEDHVIEMVVVTSSSDAQKASDVLSESAPF
jgi:hypothetical protein